MSSKWKDLAKNGWHPEKEGTTFKGQMVWTYKFPEAVDLNCYVHTISPFIGLTQELC